MSGWLRLCVGVCTCLCRYVGLVKRLVAATFMKGFFCADHVVNSEYIWASGKAQVSPTFIFPLFVFLLLLLFFFLLLVDISACALNRSATVLFPHVHQ